MINVLYNTVYLNISQYATVAQLQHWPAVSIGCRSLPP